MLSTTEKNVFSTSTTGEEGGTNKAPTACSLELNEKHEKTAKRKKIAKVREDRTVLSPEGCKRKKNGIKDKEID